MVKTLIAISIALNMQLSEGCRVGCNKEGGYGLWLPKIQRCLCGELRTYEDITGGGLVISHYRDVTMVYGGEEKVINPIPGPSQPAEENIYSSRLVFDALKGYSQNYED